MRKGTRRKDSAQPISSETSDSAAAEYRRRMENLVGQRKAANHQVAIRWWNTRIEQEERLESLANIRVATIANQHEHSRHDAATAESEYAAAALEAKVAYDELRATQQTLQNQFRDAAVLAARASRKRHALRILERNTLVLAKNLGSAKRAASATSERIKSLRGIREATKAVFEATMKSASATAPTAPSAGTGTHEATKKPVSPRESPP